MAIYWVDPYISSTNGPIHGTTDTTTRNGTYASPWSLVDLTTAAKLTGLLAGDEVRFKGLAEATFFPTAAAFTSPTYTATTSSYTMQAADAYKLVRVKDSRGVIYYTKTYSSNVYTCYGSSTWRCGAGLMDSAGPYGYYPFNTNYSITTGPGSSVAMFPSLAVSITVTSGWTSSTAQGGITVIDCMSATPFGGSMYIGASAEAAGKNITWNCPEMIITTYYGQSFYMYCNSLVLKAYCSCEYQPGYQSNFYIGANTAPYKTGSGNVTIGNAASGGYLNFYCYAGSTTTPEVNIPHMSNGYYAPSLLLYKHSSTSYNVRLKHLWGYIPLSINDQSGSQTLNLIASTDWAFEYKYSSAPAITISGTFIVNENFGSTIYTTNVFSSTYLNQFSYVTVPSSNISASTPTATTLYANSTSRIKKMTYTSTVYKAFGTKFTIETGETLETLTIPPASLTYAPPYGNPYKIQIMSETSSGRKVQFMSTTSTGDCAMIYNNSNYSNKLTWKLFGTSNGKVYADTFSLPYVSFGANGATFNASFTTTASPGITLLVKLYGINKTTGVVTNIKNATTTVNGTAITATASFTNTELVSTYNVGSMFAIVDITKTSAANCDVVFNSMSLTSP